MSSKTFLAASTPVWIASSSLIKSSKAFFASLNFCNFSVFSASNFSIACFNASFAALIFWVASFNDFIEESLLRFKPLISSNTFLALDIASAGACLVIKLLNSVFALVKLLNSASFLALISWSNLDFASSSALVAFVISSRVEFLSALFLVNATVASVVSTSFASSVLINCSSDVLVVLYFSNSLLLLIFSTSEIACFLASINNLVACWISLIKELLMFISLTFSIDFSAFALISLYFKSFKSFAM